MKMTALSVTQLSRALCQKEVSAHEVTLAYLEQTETKDPAIAAYLTVCAEQALQQAREIDRARAQGEDLPPLAGIPMAVKDNICTRGIRTTCASRMLRDFVPPYNAAVIERLYSAKAILLGKTNLDEFAMGSSTEHSAFFPTCNPLDPARTPGGSSGGSGAAVAAQCAPFALGSDAGGSIRQPAAFCGVVGMRPTYGAVSRYGLISFAPSLDQIGPMTRTVRDNALVLRAVLGHDPRDARSLAVSHADPSAQIGQPLRGLRIALLSSVGGCKPCPAVRQVLEHAVAVLTDLGCVIEETELPSLQYALPAYHVIADAEASSNLARFDGVRYGHRSAQSDSLADLYRNSRSEGFGDEVKRRILLGTFVLRAEHYDAYYRQATRVRRRITQDLLAVLADRDAILSAVTPDMPPRIGEKTADVLAMYQSDIFTVPASLAGLPALSLPGGYAEDGMPAGIQLIGRELHEGLLYRIGAAYEDAVSDMYRDKRSSDHAQ